MKKAKNVDEYIRSFPENIQKILKEMRAVIKKAVPQAQESISYGIPYYSLNGRLVYFGGQKNHIGLYPLMSGVSKFKKELKDYKTAKGTIQFPYDKKLPVGLIERIIKFRVKENLERK